MYTPDYPHSTTPLSTRLFSVFPGVSTFGYCLRGSIPKLHMEPKSWMVVPVFLSRGRPVRTGRVVVTPGSLGWESNY